MGVKLAPWFHSRVERQGAERIDRVLTNILAGTTNKNDLKRRRRRISGACNVPHNLREGIKTAVIAAGRKEKGWKRVVAQLVVDMFGEDDDLRGMFQAQQGLLTPRTKRLAPSLVAADRLRKVEEERRMQMLEAETFLDCDKCKKQKCVRVTMKKQGKRGGGGGKAVLVAHMSCTLCRYEVNDGCE